MSKLAIMPQEIEVWYLIPAIRRELSKILKNNFDKSQKEVAELLGITESAVSQYLSEKRGSELKFNKNEMSQIDKTAKQIIKDNKNSRKYLFELTKELMGSENICKLHRKNDPSIEKNCNICMRN